MDLCCFSYSSMYISMSHALNIEIDWHDMYMYDVLCLVQD